MNSPSLLIQFDPTTWAVTTVLLIGSTNLQTAKLQEMVDRMLRNIESPKRSEDEN